MPLRAFSARECFALLPDNIDETIPPQVFASQMPLWCNSRNFR